MLAYQPPVLCARAAMGRLALELDLLDPVAPRPVPVEPVEATAARILVVDDDDDLRAYVRGCLGTRWMVTEARDGREALAVAERVHPALVLTDVRMPGADGAALVQAFHAHPVLGRLPILAISGEAHGLAGADAFLPKPFTRAQLIAAVQALLPAHA